MHQIHRQIQVLRGLGLVGDDGFGVLRRQHKGLAPGLVGRAGPTDRAQALHQRGVGHGAAGARVVHEEHQRVAFGRVVVARHEQVVFQSVTGPGVHVRQGPEPVHDLIDHGVRLHRLRTGREPALVGAEHGSHLGDGGFRRFARDGALVLHVEQGLRVVGRQFHDHEAAVAPLFGRCRLGVGVDAGDGAPVHAVAGGAEAGGFDVGAVVQGDGAELLAFTEYLGDGGGAAQRHGGVRAGRQAGGHPHGDTGAQTGGQKATA